MGGVGDGWCLSGVGARLWKGEGVRVRGGVKKLACCCVVKVLIKKALSVVDGDELC